jgi:AcrR family transcriptional regulator
VAAYVTGPLTRPETYRHERPVSLLGVSLQPGAAVSVLGVVDSVYCRLVDKEAVEESGLRERLVATGVALVAEQGSSSVSLREIARRAGVSHGAPRRHFPTHQALLAAIAGHGYHDLSVRIHAADSAGKPADRVHALGRVFVDFAVGNRGMFELMFRHDLLRGNNIGLRQQSLTLFRHLVDLLADARPDLDTPHRTVVAGALWANLHGIAQLWQWGSLQVATGTADHEETVRSAVNAHLGRTTSRRR